MKLARREPRLQLRERQVRHVPHRTLFPFPAAAAVAATLPSRAASSSAAAAAAIGGRTREHIHELGRVGAGAHVLLDALALQPSVPCEPPVLCVVRQQEHLDARLLP